MTPTLSAFPDPELPLLIRSVGFHCLALLDLFKLASKAPRQKAPQPHLGAALVLFPFVNTGQHPLTNLSRSPQRPSLPAALAGGHLSPLVVRVMRTSN